ncbi:NAD-dependent epimerase/dehydratase family protein [Nonlabens antarcticus]|uniref:NAD-dependent epimerase/dehydratase family protein n=1 Tax=Nonlabens antarcticus TaxID=392714 RepID=UPI0018914D02|nr:NAD(P)-dependent oxidoreductase [Nonlabens antarcticus]
MTPKHILLTGASGTVGFEALKQLVKKGYEVTAFDKKSKASSKKLRSFENQAHVIFGDITVPTDLKQIKGSIDAVIHLAAIIPPVADDFPELAQKVNVDGTKHLLNFLETHSPEAFLIYSSSISVYGDRIIDPMIEVGDPLIPSPRDAYAITKIAAEDLIKKSKLNWTIFRLAAIMGGHKMSKLMFHQPLNTSLEIATPRDTARAFVNAIGFQEELNYKIYNLGGGESCRMRYDDFLQKSFDIFGLGKLDFPKYSFADKNFHCGYYVDGNDLENIVGFRQDSIEDYFLMESGKVSALKKAGASLFKKPIKKYLLRQSEPFIAHKTNDKKEVAHYFNSNS